MNPDYFFDEDDLINDYVQDAEAFDDDNNHDEPPLQSSPDYDSDDELQAQVCGISVQELIRRRATHRPEWASDEEAWEEAQREEGRSGVGVNDDNSNDEEEDDDEFNSTTPTPETNKIITSANATSFSNNIKKRKMMANSATLNPTKKRVVATTTKTNNNSNNVTVVSAARRSLTESLRLPKKGDDLYYNFERYKGSQEWGCHATARDDDVVIATEYRREPQSSSSSTARNNDSHTMLSSCCVTTSAGAKLVEYLEHRHRMPRRQLCISTRLDSGIRHIPKEGEDSVPMTLGNGTRVHVVRLVVAPTSNAATVQASSQTCRNILGVPMAELMRRSDAIQKASIILSHNMAKEQSAESISSPSSSSNNNNKDTNIDNYLWVDKHAPTAFSHLLSEESINREVLRAIRAWDPYVFHRQALPQRQYIHNNNNNNNSGSGGNKYNNKNGVSNNNYHNKAPDESKSKSHDLRPDEQNRVILLSGPPGVGKTTLAHILAKHAGYRPMEVNASDERSATVLKDRVLQAMESTTLKFASSDHYKNSMVGRPNCLILDEIDGADVKGAIAALVEIIRAEIPSKTNKSSSSSSSTKSSSKPQHKKPFLRRPMIFICNHKYAPALRPLLPYCRHFDVMPPSTVRLVARLRAILTAERVTVGGSSNVLNQLVVSSGGDIRSCLYTLQFASARAREVVTKQEVPRPKNYSNDIMGVDVAPMLASAVGGSGVKDERNDVASIITSIFRKRKERTTERSAFNNNNNNNNSSNNNNKPKATIKVTGSVDRVMDLVKSLDDHAKTLDSMFMNVMRVSYIDPTLDRCAAAHEWMSGADLFRSNGGGSMQSWHIPSSAAAIHLMCRVETRANLTFSTRELTDAYYQHEANVGLTQRFMEGASIRARTNMRMACLATETIPYALWMLSAGNGSCSLNRAASTIERLSPSELQAFHSHVSTLLSLGLKYVAADDAAVTDALTIKSRATAVQLRLDPPIDTLIRFADLIVTPNQERNAIHASLKELLAQHSVQEGMRDRSATTPSSANESVDVGLITQPPPIPPVDCLPEQECPPQLDFPASTTQQNNSARSIKVKPIGPPKLEPAPKRARTQTFLGLGAVKVKAARTAKRVAKVGFLNTNQSAVKLSNTGSGVPLQEVIRFKYQKGFTQAVRTPCRWEDLLG